MENLRSAAVTVTAFLVLGACAGKNRTNIVEVRDGERRAATDVAGWDELHRLPIPHCPTELGDDVDDCLRAWDALRIDDLSGAHRYAVRMMARHPEASSPHILAGFIELRSGGPRLAERHFRTARELSGELSGSYTLALAGAFLAALSERQPVVEAGASSAASPAQAKDDAFETLEEIRARQPDHPFVSSFRDPLRLELAEAWLGRARALGAVSPGESASAYRRCVSFAPESGELLFEAAEVHVSAGRLLEAEQFAARAVAEGVDDARTLAAYADILLANGKAKRALTVYRRAESLEPWNETLSERRRALARDVHLREIPAPYFDIRKKPRLTREELAAILHVELGEHLERVPRRPVIVTDVDASWARHYILEVLALGLMTARPNHTFEPAGSVSDAVFWSALEHAAGVLDGRAQRVAVTPRGVSMPRRAGARELVHRMSVAAHSRPISGADAIEAVTRLADWSRAGAPARGESTASGIEDAGPSR